MRYVRRRWLLTLVGLAALITSACGAETIDQLLMRARAALGQGQGEEALMLTSKAIAQDAQSAPARFLHGLAHEMLERHAEAIADFDKTIQLDPGRADAYQHRGSEHFKLAHIRESLADFDKFLELRPDARPGHWQRGISLYYAGRFDEGRQQFGAYEKVDTNDVENAVWHFLCAARASGPDKARAGLLRIGHDHRVPLMQVYALFAGQAKPEAVLNAATAGNPPLKELNQHLFYAHLYLGLYYEVQGDREKMLEHMGKAAGEYRLPGYMGDVARVHLELRRKEAQK